MTPVSARLIAPPLIIVIERNFIFRWSEHRGAGNQVFRRRAGKFFFRRCALGDGYVACYVYKLLELFVS